ncbi:MAG: hypothetical protein U9Q29_04055 [Campylobacterota bacterium]|nr:hypothetical protein [Campylobacterota bacterium]
MSRTQAIRYLKYLHTLEMSYRGNLITQDMAIVVEKVRLEFLASYRR